jgi:acyl carrier protein
MTNTADRIRQILVSHLSVDEAPDTALIVDDLGADSLDTVELVILVEDEFGIEIPDDSTLHLHTVGDLIAVVEGLV